MAKKAKKADLAGRSAIQEDEREKHQAWLNWLRDEKGESFSTLAEKAGVSNNTLTRNFSREGALLDALTVRLLREHWKVEGPETYLLPGFGGYPAEGLPFDPEKFPDIGAAVAHAVKAKPGLQAFVLNTTALEHSGFAPGDIVLIDSTVRAESGDATMAIRSDGQSSKAKLLFRLVEQPFLRGDCNDPALKKSVHINENITIVGPIVGQFRQRRR